MDLKTKLGNLVLENPFMPASGPLTGTGDKLVALSNYHLGALVTKTISTTLPQLSRPFMRGEKNFIMNVEPWSEYGVDTWEKEFLPQVRRQAQQPLFVSLGYTDSDMRALIPRLDHLADGYEISTHYVGKELAPMRRTIQMLRSLTEKPIYMKISPHFPNPAEFAEMVMEHGGNGVVAINSLGPAMRIDLEKRRVVMGNQNGVAWMSGPAVKPIALALVSTIKRAVPECEVIGVGGVESAKDVVEFLLAGASAVQMLSAALLHGHQLYRKILEDLPGVLEQYHFSSVADVIHTPLQMGGLSYEVAYPHFEQNRCISCGICEKVCPFFAISRGAAGMVADHDKCMGCGLCRTRCPKQAISGV